MNELFPVTVVFFYRKFTIVFNNSNKLYTITVTNKNYKIISNKDGYVREETDSIYLNRS